MSSAYEQAFQKLNDAQKQAVTTIEGPVLVIAGPGTGKTQLLTTRIAHILQKTDSLPQNILCLTFTDSGARTMRERLAGMIGQAAYDVTISTYHAFGADLIRRFPDYLDAAADLEPADDLAMDGILRGIVAQLPYSNPLKYADNYLRDIKTLISDAKRALLAPKDLRAIAKENLTFIQNTNPLVSSTLESVARIDKKAVPLFAQIQQALPDVHTPQENRAIQPLSTLFGASLAEAVAAAQESGKTLTITAWKNNWLAKDETGHFIVDGTKANQKLYAAAEVYERYLQSLTDEGLFDYDDMILRAVHALETNADLRYTLQEQYLYILLDEFQDTNGAQLRLVELLTDNPVHEGRPNILAVGDDDQAIYAFQGAHYSHMLQFRDMYRDVVAIPLVENYRSHAEILSIARGVAEQIEERLHHHFPSIEKILVARTKSTEAPIVERREAQSDVMQYAWVAKRIRALIDRGMPASEIAVLAPQHKHLEPLIPFLQQANIPMRYEKRENVLDDPRIVELLRMSELTLALAKNKTSVANALWPQILSFDFWNLPTSTIWKLNWRHTDGHEDWTNVLMDDANLQPIALFFIRLSQLAAAETLEVMFDYLIGSAVLDLHEPDSEPFTSPFYEHYFGSKLQAIDESTDFWNLLSNLIILRARLREYRGNNEAPLLLGDFIIFVEAMRAAELKVLNTSPYASGDESVSLMTAFKAKGMEWQAVFVLAVNDEAWGNKSHTASVRISLPPNLQFIRYAGATNDERLRLFYVALTRAKSQLYLTSYLQNFAGRSMSHLKYLDENTDEEGIVHSPLLPAEHAVVLPAEDGLPAPTTELSAYWGQRHEAALQEPALRTLLAERLSHYQLSPTHLNAFVDLVHAGPQSFFMKTILRFPQAPSPEMQFGNAVHETLEWAHHAAKQTSKTPNEAQLITTFEKKLQAKELSTQDQQLFLTRGQDALRTYWAQRAQELRLTDRVEYNFKNEGVFIGEAHLSGKIDKLIIDPKAKTISIVDYKTGKSHNRWSREIKLHKYRQQLYLYKALVEGSHTFAGYTVVDAYLDFVEADETGHIQTLYLDFVEAEYQYVKKLAEIVWKQVTTLDLPDTNAYSKDMHGVEDFEADLLNSLK